MDGATKRPALSSFGAENGPACSKTALHRNSDAEPHGQTELTYVFKKTKAQMAANANGEKLPATWVETEQLHCLMVFDTESKQFVGSGCYVVGPLPPPGTLAQFESVTAEFVGTGITPL
jgi:hypothetical protein